MIRFEVVQPEPKPCYSQPLKAKLFVGGDGCLYLDINSVTILWIDEKGSLNLNMISGECQSSVPGLKFDSRNEINLKL